MKTLAERLAWAMGCVGMNPHADQSELARLVGGNCKPQNIQSILSGSQKSSKYTPKIALVLQCDAVWLATGEGKSPAKRKHNLAVSGAESTSQKTGLFTDHKPDASPTIGGNDTTPGLPIHGEVPLISWDQARTWDTLMHSFAKEDAERLLPCPAPHSAGTFCLPNNTEAMDDGTASGYREGEILFVDPGKEATPERDVIVILPSGKMLFRRLKEDSEGRYLLALNGKRIERWEEGTIVRGVVIFSGMFR